MSRDLERVSDTGLIDRAGRPIRPGDKVSLDGNITADDSMGVLPNGWCFEEDDVYRVVWDERIENWTLDIPNVDPFKNPYDCKFMNHAVSLLHDGAVTIVES